MGFSVSGSAAIVFIAAFVSVGILYSAAYNGYEDVTAAQDGHADRVLDQRNTAVDITATTYNDTAETLTVQVLNQGSTTLSVAATDVVVDGVYQGTWIDSNVSGSTSTDVWAPGETLNVTLEASTDPGRVKVVTEHGVSDTEVR